MPFQFGDDTPFQWNPANPLFGFAGNILSFIAPPFERYMVTAVRQAMLRIDDPAVAAGLRTASTYRAIHSPANCDVHLGKLAYQPLRRH